MDQNETGKHMFRGINVFLRDKIFISDFAEILKRFPQDFKQPCTGLLLFLFST